MYRANEIAAYIGHSLVGDDIEVVGFSQLSNPQPATVVFAKRYREEFVGILAARRDVLAIVTGDYSGKIECPYIVSENPRMDYVRVLSRFFPPEGVERGIHPTAVIERGAVIGANVSIGAHCYVSGRCVIGDDTVIHANVTLDNEVHIGRGCEIKSGVVMGQDGFGFERDEEGRLVHFPHYGRVIVGDGVFVGANSCIDRGTIGDTVVERDVKIDNLVHIAHNCRIGQGSLIIASTVLCGGVQVGRDCWVAPNVSIKEHIHVGDKSYIGLGAVVLRDVEEGSVMVGNPAYKIDKKREK